MEKIKVALRMRPFSQEEITQRRERGWKLDDHNSTIEGANPQIGNQTFTFDHVFSEIAPNDLVYENTARDLVMKALEGYDTTIFVYGQTGAGKTHTMLGPGRESFKFNGVIFNGLSDVFDKVKNRDGDEQYAITASYLEIYNELVYDLLNKPDNLSEHLIIFEDVTKDKFKVKNQTKVKVENLDEVYKVLKYGETNRKYAETYFNHKSSRSHTIFTVHIKYMKYSGEQASFIKESVLNFVDLAGNERLLYEYKTRGAREDVNSKAVTQSRQRSKSPMAEFYDSSSKNQRLNESKHINKSLFFLTQVIYLCSRGKKLIHIPFRNSPLTKILRSSFGGNSRTLLILCVSPCMDDSDITMSTLRFGQCAKKIENAVKSNVISAYNREAINSVIEAYEKKLADCYSRIEGMDNYKSDVVELIQTIKSLRDSIYDRKYEKKAIEKIELCGKVYDEWGYEERYEDIINIKSGVLLTLKQPTIEDYLKKKVSDKIWESGSDKFSKKTMPKLVERFKNKLQGEVAMEDFMKNALGEIVDITRAKDNLIVDFVESAKNSGKFIYDYIYKLMDKISGLRDELSTYTDFNKIKDLTDWDLDQQYRNIKKMMGVFQEERIRRKVVSELKLKTSKLGDQSSIFHINQAENFQDEELEEFRKFKTKFENTIEDKATELIEMQSEYDVESYVNETITKLTEHVDTIYENSFLIQKFMENENNKVKKRFNVMESEIKLLNEAIKRFTSDSDKSIENRDGFRANKSFDDICNIKQKFEPTEESDPQENGLLLMYQGLATKMMSIERCAQNFDQLQAYQQEDYRTHIMNNLNAGLEPTDGLQTPYRDLGPSARNTNLEQNNSRYQTETEPEQEQDRDQDSAHDQYEFEQSKKEEQNVPSKSQFFETKTTQVVYATNPLIRRKESNDDLFNKPYRDESPYFIQREEDDKGFISEARDIEFDADISQVPHLNQKSFVSDTREAIAMFKINSMKRDPQFAQNAGDKINNFDDPDRYDDIEIDDQVSIDSSGMRAEPDLIPRQPINIIPRYEKPSINTKLKKAMNKTPAFSSKINSGEYKEKLSPLKTKQTVTTTTPTSSTGYSSRLKKR